MKLIDYESSFIIHHSVIRKELAKGKIFIAAEFEFDQLKLSGNFPELYVLDGYLTLSPYSFALRKGWNWTNGINKLFIQYGLDGSFETIKREHLAKTTKILENPSQAIKVEKFAGTFITLTTVAIFSNGIALFLGILQRKKLSKAVGKVRK